MIVEIIGSLIIDAKLSMHGRGVARSEKADLIYKVLLPRYLFRKFYCSFFTQKYICFNSNINFQ